MQKQHLKAMNRQRFDRKARKFTAVYGLTCLLMQGASLEDRIKSMSVSEADLLVRRLTKAEFDMVQNALSGSPSQEVLVCPWS